MNDALEKIRQEVNKVLLAQKDIALQSEGWTHLYGVSQAAVLLASHRALDSNLCAAAGLLHDIYTFRTAQEKDHALHGAAEAAQMLRATASWSDADIAAVSAMILRHSDKQTIDSPMEECLKDADVLAHWLYDREKKMNAPKRVRLAKIMAELGITGVISVE
jgi:uncharacterized protein